MQTMFVIGTTQHRDHPNLLDDVTGRLDTIRRHHLHHRARLLRHFDVVFKSLERIIIKCNNFACELIETLFLIVQW